MVFLAKLPTIKYTTSSYSLDIDLTAEKLAIIMQLHQLPLSTRRLKKTNSLLEKHLPSIFLNQCFNEGNLSFYEEAKNTEIGHLFEHILLENLARLKDNDCTGESLRGKTSWNWVKEPLGKFHIQLQPIDVGRARLFECLRESIELTNVILASSKSKKMLH
jgi:hypothetical protein